MARAGAPRGQRPRARTGSPEVIRGHGRLRRGPPHSSRLRHRDGYPYVRLRRGIQYYRDAFPSQQGRRQCRSDCGRQRDRDVAHLLYISAYADCGRRLHSPHLCVRAGGRYSGQSWSGALSAFPRPAASLHCAVVSCGALRRASEQCGFRLDDRVRTR